MTIAQDILDSSTYLRNHLMFGSYHLWVDTTGALRIKAGTLTTDLDGTIVGTQT